MATIIAFDSHKHYSQALVQTLEGKIIKEQRIEHVRGSIKTFLSGYEYKTPVAVETIGNWYWIIDEIEQAGMMPKLVHARKAKLMLGCVNKTDKLDVLGLNKLQRIGTLPTVWIPPGELRDKRELPRTRMVFARMRTKIKNRIHSVLNKYGFSGDDDISDIFGSEGRRYIERCRKHLPVQTSYTLELLLRQLDVIEAQIKLIEKRMEEVFEKTEEVKLLMSIPGIGPILAVVISLEIGDISRFSSSERLASYAGTTPRVHSSGDKTRYGRLREDVNRYLKWAYAEAGNSVALNVRHCPDRHVSVLYNRLRIRKGHSKAIGAVARHIAEASYWILTRKQVYKERNIVQVSSRGHKRVTVMSR